MATISEIQGAGHTSPLASETVTAEGGIVTAVLDNGFYIQDPEGDNNPSTSEGLFIFTGNTQPTVKVGDEVNVTGKVNEFQPGPEEARNLTQTQIAFPDNVEVLSSDNELPDPVVIGEGGRIPPSENIDDDSFSEFNPNEAGIDFFESLEAMRVTAQDTVAVSPTNRFGEIFTVTDNGENATGISDRGTLNISEDDLNPEKVQIDFESSLLPNFDFPQVNTGAQLGDVTGVVSYDFGNFQIQPTEEFTATSSNIEPETSTIEAGGKNLTLASYNVLNLDPKVENVNNVISQDQGEVDDDVGNGRFDAIANQIVNNLNTPDIIGLQEIQDNDGAEITNFSAADKTLQLLADKIAEAGGPNYEFIDTPGIVPASNENGNLVRPTGGQPGGNIRNAFLYNPERVNLVESEPLTNPQDQANNPENPFFGSRIPLSATFEFNGEQVTVINNHFSSKSGSSAILGQDQPFEELQEGQRKGLPESDSDDKPDSLDDLEPDARFVNGSYNKRSDQVEAVKQYVDSLNAKNIVALGDLNEFEFVDPVQKTLGSSLNNLVETVPEDERYSFIFQGNSQQLDHILVNDNLAEQAQLDIVHSNAEFAETPERASDHEPLAASLNLSNNSDMDINLNSLGTFETGIFDEGAAEIVSYDPETQRLFVVNSDATTVDILDVSNPNNPTRVSQIDASQFGDGANSVAVKNGIVAVAIEAGEIDANGQVVFFDTDGNQLASAEVGILPDKVAFSPDGSKVLTANEAEPNSNYTVDPKGSISIIDISGGAENLSIDNVTNAGFTQFNNQKQELIDQGVRIFGPSPGDDKETATVAQDLEPEFVTVTSDSNTAYVSLQENNALAKVDLNAGEVSEIIPLGVKDHSQPENQLDPSDEDGKINFQNIPSLGMFQPDAIDNFQINGKTYIVTANEGDAREYEGDPGFVEEVGLQDLLDNGRLDLNDDGEADVAGTQVSSQETVNDLLAPERLGELDFSNSAGDTDGDGLIEQLQNFGGRSFSIWNESGKLVSDSADSFEQIIADQINQGNLPKEAFNADNTGNDSFDSRSDDKGPEPEAITIGRVNDTPYAFIGLERIGGIMVYNVSNPSNPQFVQYVNNRDFSVDFNTNSEGEPSPTETQLSQAGDLGPEGLKFISAENSANGNPLLAVGNEVSGTTTVYNVADIDEKQQETYSLQLLHASDLEGGVDAISNAPNFAAIIDQLEEKSENTLTISAGDNVIPGPFFNAALFADNQVFNDAANNLFGLPSDVNSDGQPEQYESLEGDRGRIDMSIMNAIGFDASAVGNHEFDGSPDAVEGFVQPDFGDTSGIADDKWVGTQFPYLSANLDFSNDGDLSDIATSDVISESEFITGPEESLSGETTPRLAPAAIFERGGEQIGVVGATTPILREISSPGSVELEGPTENDMQALAEVLQPTINNITDQGVNKVILTTHLQQIALEQELIGELSGVDIVIAGGSDTILADNTDTLRSGDEAADSYPIITENADGDPAAIVSTAGEYSYVGRLVAEFDSEGVLLPESIDPEVSGAFASTEEVVNQVSGDNDPFAEGTKGSQVQNLVNSVEDVVSSQDGSVFGETEVFLDGRREQVRTEETNLGNLTADANLEIAQAEDDSVVVSIKNGGGIRAPIGEVGDQGQLLPPQANSDVGKGEGEISQLDIVNSLRFNNGLSVLTVTRGELEKLIEHGVADTAPGNTPGQFPQVSGLEFSFDPTKQAIAFNDDGTVATEGQRVQSLAITNENGETVDTIVENGELVGDPSEEIRLVTLNFLAEGGDGYPFPAFGENRVDLVQPDAERTGQATFANDGSEQDALAEYLVENFPVDDDPNTPAFSQEETPPSEDDRIVNLEQQQPEEPEPAGPVFGSSQADTLEATIDFKGSNNILFTGTGNDQVFASQGAGNNRFYTGQGNDELVAGSQDRLFGGAGNDTLEASIGQGNNRLYAGAGNDDLIAGYQDRLFGGDGDDRLFLSEGEFEGGGNNTVTGGAGEDQFWLANAQLPGKVNTITDFSAGEDVLGIAGLDLAFADLSIGASDENADNTVIATDSQELAILVGVQDDSLTEGNFVFENSAVS